MKPRVAVTRTPSASLAGGLTTADLGPPDHGLALRQHEAYVGALRACGLEVVVLDSLPEHPDAHFVEDTAVVTPGVAVLTNPGAPARRGEVAPMESVLARHRPIARITPPATLEGGDVLHLGERLVVGFSSRTNEEGTRQLSRLVADFGGGSVETVPVGRGLHLKASVSLVAEDTLLLTRDLDAAPAFAGLRRIVLADGDEYAANTLRVGDSILIPRGFPRVRESLESLGNVVELDVSEMRKMDGGMSCMSIVF